MKIAGHTVARKEEHAGATYYWLTDYNGIRPGDLVEIKRIDHRCGPAEPPCGACERSLWDGRRLPVVGIKAVRWEFDYGYSSVSVFVTFDHRGAALDGGDPKREYELTFDQVVLVA